MQERNYMNCNALSSDLYRMDYNTAVYKRAEFCEPPEDLDRTNGYISCIMVGGKKYKLRCEIVEVHPLTCTKCGSPLELHNGHGKCEYCGTSYSAIMSIVEDK